ncbi:signal peptidase I [Leucobacter luti]|uniref:Signal peptidase I n=1 Tax=Leucobacter luti TaxID=340320 RepID=A0A4Q7TZT0_9MICO|nr:signal peptidase I [Leucobacter luti]RZT66127.1 signal peptidase [Leucobacter luti]
MERFRSVLLTIFAIIGTFCILVFGVSLVFGLKPEIVVSGSMEPTIPTGSLLLVQETSAAEAEVGDIVTLERPRNGGLVTHRITSIEQEYTDWKITMRGDANAADDPQPYVTRTVGAVVATIPGAGYVAGMFRTPFGIAGIAVVALALVVAFAWQPRSRKAVPGEVQVAEASR